MKINPGHLESFREKAVKWATSFDVSVVLDNHLSVNACSMHEYELIVAAGAKRKLTCDTGNAFDQLKAFLGQSPPDAFIPGFLTYDLKNEIERLHSQHDDHIGFPALFFFEPVHFIAVDRHLNLHGDLQLYEAIAAQEMGKVSTASPLNIQQRISREAYMKDVEQIRGHIIDGDLYEMNYCMELYAEGAEVDPLELYLQLARRSPTPFGAWVKVDDRYLLCASPERFMTKKQQRLISQPIKGTIRRGTGSEEDEQLKSALLHSEKERAENLMIVDLVRNDLAWSAETGSVHVDELFGIYSFEHVHQMISTVSCTMRKDVHPVDAIRNAFPMGSMTGAPKIKAMELIEHYERTKRGLYSGAVGYFAPGGDFDFNVVIRSIQYHAGEKYLSLEAGGAITYDSDPAQEYDECMLKAKAMLDALGITR